MPYDKIRILNSRDVKYGQPQYVFHTVLDGQKDPGMSIIPVEPFAANPLTSAKYGQHFVAFRGKDPKPIGSSHPDHGCTGNIYVQEAFDKKGRLRFTPGKELSNAGPVVRSLPVDEIDGGIYVYFGHDDAKKGTCVADSVTIHQGVPLPATKDPPSLSTRLSEAGKQTLVDSLSKTLPPRIESLASTAERPPHEKYLGQNSPLSAVSQRRHSMQSPPRSAAASPLPRTFAGSPMRSAAQTMLNLPMLPTAVLSPSRSGDLGNDISKAGLGGWNGYEGDLGTAESPGTTARSLEDLESLHSERDRDMEELLIEARANAPRHVSYIKGYQPQGHVHHLHEDQADQYAQLPDDVSSEQDPGEIWNAKVSEGEKVVSQIEKQIAIREREKRRYEKEVAAAQALLDEILAVGDPLRQNLKRINDKVDAQKVLLDKYLEEHGEKGIFRTLKREIREEQAKAHVVEGELLAVQPKEFSKRKQFEAKKEALDVELKKLEKLEERRDRARGELEHARTVLQSIEEGHAHDLEEELQGAAHDLRLLAGDELTRQADGKKHEQARSRGEETPMIKSPLAVSKPAFEKREMKEYMTLPAPEEYHKYFATGESWVHRQALAARATSPRWRERLLRELQLWKSQLPEKAKVRAKYQDPTERPGIPDSYFEAKVRMATPIADKFIMFCKLPPPPYTACIKVETVVNTPEQQTIKVIFEREPHGFFHTFVLAFKKHALREQDDVWAGSVVTLAKGTCELATYTSLRERWAGEGLSYDAAEDLKNLAGGVRPEETRYLAALRENHPYPITKLDQKPDRSLVEKMPFLRSATWAMVESVQAITEVLEAPEHAWVVDQGALGDAMYYVVSGRLKEVYLSGGAPVGAGREYTHGDAFGEVSLLEFDRENTATVECVEASVLYRVRRDAFHTVLPRFPGWYENLFALSDKRLPEFERKSKPGGDVPSGAKDHGLPARWPQMGGTMYQEAHSNSLRAGRRGTAGSPTKQLPRHAALTTMSDSWRRGKLDLATMHSERRRVESHRPDDWWRDRDPDLGDMELIGQAKTTTEMIGAVHSRALSLAWRKDCLRMAGRAVVDAIK